VKVESVRDKKRGTGTSRMSVATFTVLGISLISWSRRGGLAGRVERVSEEKEGSKRGQP